MHENSTEFRSYFNPPPFMDRFATEPDGAVDVIIPVLHTNELWRSNLISAYREIPIARLLIGDGGCIDDTIKIAKEFPRVVVYDHREFKSLGFSIKQLIEAVETDWFIYLHSDVHIPAGWFDVMQGEKKNYDWFESGQYTTIFLRWLAPTSEVNRAYSGGQMGRKQAFDKVIEKIDDDYLYRNEDIIFARLIEDAGFRYGKTDETFIDHQQMIKESPWLRRVKGLSFDLELGPEEEIRAASTYVRGIIKYLRPDQATDLIAGLRVNLYRLGELGALDPDEFAQWVAETNPAWSDIFPKPAPGSRSTLINMILPASASPASSAALAGGPVKVRVPTFRERLRWAPSAIFRKAGRLFDRIATKLMPSGGHRGY